jgi:hypothetical protein
MERVRQLPEPERKLFLRFMQKTLDAAIADTTFRFTE